MSKISPMKNSKTANTVKKNFTTQKDSTAIYTEEGALTKYGRSLERKAQRENLDFWQGAEAC